MSKVITVAVDAMGGDNSPSKIINGINHHYKKSGEYRLSHHIDLKTGIYKGRQVLDPKE